ncbi:hypothetical protein EST38_g8082 [Candolleomyces aberdarensis]|uniref:Brix domain-containing protein n=1 Tax=Candolleomyces aberdarensis TaxID=2316362 RepID=A0A4Q2DDH9_9AGAR|nr:hypothetical protein EST38_g8082 [Candolleomyces aberdarensis]
MPPTRFAPSQIKNKIKREQLAQKAKKAKAQAKLQKRLAQAKLETNDPAVKKKRLAENVPRTLDNMREFDPSIMTADPSSSNQPEGSTSAEATQNEQNADISTDPFASYFSSIDDPTLPPKVLITTSFKASKSTYEFCDELVGVFPGAEFRRRKKGKGFEMGRIAGWAADRDYKHLLVVNEDMKKPNAITLVHLPNGPTAYFKLTSIELTKQIFGHARATPHYPELILNGFVTRLGHAVGRMFQTTFPPLPEFQGRQVVTLHNQRDFIFFRRHRLVHSLLLYYDVSDSLTSYAFRSPEKVALQEIGPRFTLKLRSLKKNIPAVYNLGESPAPLTIEKDNDEDDPVGELEGQVGEQEQEEQNGKQPSKTVPPKQDEFLWQWKVHMNILQGSKDTHVQNLVAYQVEGDLNHHGSVSAEQSLCNFLLPITDASHTRDRKRSPPDSACFPGTRSKVVVSVNTWARGDVTTVSEPHLRWMHGYVGSGKSSISQEVCDTSEREERPVISFFFFRNAGDRSKIWRLATTLASQMAAVIPQTEPFIREAVQANPALLTQDEGGVSLRTRMECLVYAPFKAVVRGKKRVRALTQGPFLIVLDGLDECDNKDEVQELIDGMLMLFNKNPLIPLRVFITSRVEEHIQSRLNVPAVMLDNLVDHCSDYDIATFLQILFKDACRRNLVVGAYVQKHGEWPTQSDRRNLVKHIGGSFIFASAVFKFIMATSSEGSHPPTPMDRLPLALKMNPGLDGLYTQTLARSMHLPHFSNIISTIALLWEPLPISGIAELLGIETYEVVNVLVNLQAIIQVPGTDRIPVTLCHTSLRDFLTTESRSRDFFAHPSHHVHLCLRCLDCRFKVLREDPDLFTRPGEQFPAVVDYAFCYSTAHMNQGQGCFKLTESDSAIHLCREALALKPNTPDLITALADAVHNRANQTKSLSDLDEALFLYRRALELYSSFHPGRSLPLIDLSDVLLDRHRCTRSMADLEEAISLYREVLRLPPSHYLDRSDSFENLGDALLGRRRMGIMADLEEAISLLREALELRPSPHPYRSVALENLIIPLQLMYGKTQTLSYLQEAIAHCEELLAFHRPVGHRNRAECLRLMDSLLQLRFDATGQEDDLSKISMLEEEANRLSTSSTEPIP